MVLAILIGIIRGGRFSNIGTLRFKNWWLFVASLISYLTIVVLGAAGNSIVVDYINELYALTYGMLIIGIFMNVKYKPIMIIGFGALMNLVSFIMNKGIPVSVEGLKLAGETQLADLITAGEKLLYVPFTTQTSLPILSKTIIFQANMPFERVLSFGDVVIMIGVFVFIQYVLMHPDMDRYVRIRF